MSSPFMPPQSTPAIPTSNPGNDDVTTGQAYSPFTAAPTSARVVGSPFGDSTAKVAGPIDVSPGSSPVQQPTGTSGAAWGRPTSVRAATFSLLTAGVLCLVLAGFGVFAIWELRDSADQLLNLDPSGTVNLFASDYADDTETVLTVIVVAIGALLAIAYMLMARFVWKGHKWPRNVSPFLVVLSLPALFLGFVGIAIVAAGVAATVAAWMPSARAFSTQCRRA